MGQLAVKGAISGKLEGTAVLVEIVAESSVIEGAVLTRRLALQVLRVPKGFVLTTDAPSGVSLFTDKVTELDAGLESLHASGGTGAIDLVGFTGWLSAISNNGDVSDTSLTALVGGGVVDGTVAAVSSSAIGVVQGPPRGHLAAASVGHVAGSQTSPIQRIGVVNRAPVADLAVREVDAGLRIIRSGSVPCACAGEGTEEDCDSGTQPEVEGAEGEGGGAD